MSKLQEMYLWWKEQPWHKAAELGLSVIAGALAGAGLVRATGYTAAGAVKPTGEGTGTHAENVGATVGGLTGAAAYTASQTNWSK